MKKTLQYHIKLILEKAECIGAQLDLDQVVAANTLLLWDMHWKSMHVSFACICNQVACTSQLQTWNQPRKRVLEPSEVSSIKFVKLEHGKVKRPITCKFYDPHPQQSSHTGMCRQLATLCMTDIP